MSNVIIGKPNIVLIGGGGHCSSVIDIIEKEGRYNILGILDNKQGELLGYPIIGDDSLINELISDNTFFIITVGQIKTYEIRERIAKKLEESKAKLATIISPLAYVSKHADIGVGTIVMHGSIVNAQAKVGKHCILNTKSNIEHGVVINDFCHISTCVVVNGDSTIGRGVFLGSNSTISNGIIIKEDSIISAGKFVKK
ncbi:acetyltransferase [Aquimarina agarilytica]|uniref:acetyltransferase n=1 Tax=Aquimarina agarilytica TaxID=1087449 RepID=UPI0002886A11|nr:acetyltransferase [Aquimarina agarilytica]